MFKNVDDAFPLYIPGWEGKLSAKIDAKQLGNGEITGDYATKIQGLLFALDEQNQSLMMNFRGAYVAYSADPCGNADLLRRQVELILKEQTRFQMIRLNIRGLVALAAGSSSHDKIIDSFQTIVQAVGGTVVVDAAAVEITRTRKVMNRWIEDSDD